MSYRSLVISIILGFVAVGAAAQESRTNYGVLTCTLAKGADKKIALKGPTQAVRCVFKATAAGADENYVGTIQHSTGKEVLTEKLVLMFAVSAPSNLKAKAGWLQQSYVARAPAMQLLVGETNKDIVLQFETGDGSRGGFSVSRVELKLATTPV
jgi:hypothetical protein